MVWQKSSDPNTGRVFYANHAARSTQWHPPAGWVDDPNDLQYGGHVASDSKALPVPPRSSSNHDPSPLPPGWESRSDPRSGKTFYVHHATATTTWTRPGGETPPPAPTTARPRAASDVSTGSSGPVPVALPKAAQSREEWLAAERAAAEAFERGMLPGVAEEDDAAAARRLHEELNGSDNGAKTEKATEKRVELGTAGIDAGTSLGALPTTNNYQTYVSGDTVDFRMYVPPPVPDAKRSKCVSCPTMFSTLGMNRRHHCRLCGEIFCQACSSHTIELPLQVMTGLDTSKLSNKSEGGVRVCDDCKEDIDRRGGDAFTMLRYLIPLAHFDHAAENSVAEMDNIRQALRCLHADIDRLVQSGGGSNMVPPPRQVVGPLARHLGHHATELPALLALGAVLSWAGMRDDGSYAAEAYAAPSDDPFEEFDGDAPEPTDAQSLMASLLGLLERNAGSGNADTLATQEQAARVVAYLTDRNVLSYVPGSALDVHGAMASCLDHLTSSHVGLQRWSAACAVNLLLEDGRRWTDGVERGYRAFTPLLCENGGAMIFCSALSTEDMDARAHACRALEVALASCRAMRPYGGAPDQDLVRAIVAAGGCQSGGLSNMLLSSEDASVEVALSLLLAIVGSVLTPHAAKAADEAAAATAQGPVARALLSLLAPARSRPRTLAIRLEAMKIVACLALASKKRPAARRALEDAGLMEICLGGLCDGAISKEGMAMREASAIALHAVVEQNGGETLWSRHPGAMRVVLTASRDPDMGKDSAVRETTLRILPLLGILTELLLAVVKKMWEEKDRGGGQGPAKAQEYLIECLEADVISLLTDVLAKVEARGAIHPGTCTLATQCQMVLACLFSLAFADVKNATASGARRLLSVVKDTGNRKGTNVVTSTIAVLLMAADSHTNTSTRVPSHITQFICSGLTFLANACGLFLPVPDVAAPTGASHEAAASFASNNCSIVSGLLLSSSTVFPTLLMGHVYGSSCIRPALSLMVTLSKHGPPDIGAGLASSGALAPLLDLARNDRSTVPDVVHIFRIAGKSGGQEALAASKGVMDLAVTSLREGGEVPPDEALRLLEGLSLHESLRTQYSSPQTLQVLVGCLGGQGDKVGNALTILKRLTTSTDADPTMQAAMDCGLVAALVHLVCGEDVNGHASVATEAPPPPISAVAPPSRFRRAAAPPLAPPPPPKLRRGSSYVPSPDAASALYLLASLSEKDAAVHGEKGLMPSGALRAALAVLASDSAEDVPVGLVLLQNLVRDVTVWDEDGPYGTWARGEVAAAARLYPGAVGALLGSLAQEAGLEPTLCGPGLRMEEGTSPDLGRTCATLLFVLAAACEGGPAFWDAAHSEADAVTVAGLTAFLRAVAEDNHLPLPSEDRSFYMAYRTPILETLLDVLARTLEGAARTEESPDLLPDILTKMTAVPSCLRLCRSEGSGTGLVGPACEVLKSILRSWPQLCGLQGEGTLDALLGLLQHAEAEARGVAVDYLHRVSQQKEGEELRAALAARGEGHEARARLLAGLAAALGRAWSPAPDGREEVTAALNIIVRLVETRPGTHIVLTREEGETLAHCLAEPLAALVMETVQGMPVTRKTKAYAVRPRARGVRRGPKTEGYVVAEEPQTPEYRLLCGLVESGTNMHDLARCGAIQALVAVAHGGVMSALGAIETASKVDPWAVIDAGGHLSSLSILSSFFSEELTLKPVIDQEKARDLIVSSLRLLGSLGRASSHHGSGDRQQHPEQHRDVLVDAVMGGKDGSDGPDVVSLCAGLVQACAEASSTVRPSSPSEKKLEEAEEADVSVSPSSSPKASSPSLRYEYLQQVSISALFFLTEISQATDCRDILTAQVQLLQAVLQIVRDTSSLQLEQAGVSFLNIIGPFMTEEEIIGDVSKALMDVLTKAEESMTSDATTENDTVSEHLRSGTLAQALNAVECFSDVTPHSTQERILSATLVHFLSLFDFQVEAAKDIHDGELVCATTTLFLSALGSVEGRRALLVPEVVAALLRLGAAGIEDDDAPSVRKSWGCARTQSFQILAALMRRRDGCELVADTIMEMENGGYVIVEVMDQLVTGADFVAVNAIRRILQCI